MTGVQTCALPISPIQVSGRFVGKQDGRPVDQSPGQGHSLLLPAGKLDPKNSWEIMKLLEKINEGGTTILVVTHNREIVNEMRKRVVTMKKGVIVSDEEKGGYIDEN